MVVVFREDKVGFCRGTGCIVVIAVAVAVLIAVSGMGVYSFQLAIEILWWVAEVVHVKILVTWHISYGNGIGSGQEDKYTEPNPPTTILHSSSIFISVTALGCFNRVAHPLLLRSCRNTVESRKPAATTSPDSHSTLVTWTWVESEPSCWSI